MAAAAPASTEVPTGFRRVWRALRQLFHEMTGAVFVVLALAWGRAALLAYSRDARRLLVGAAAGVAALMIFFAWSSFRRAQRVR